MANPLKKRARRLARELRRSGRSAPVQDSPTRRARGLDGPYLPPSWPDDLEGGAGVREPRRPAPTAPAGALELEEPTSQRLNLVS